MNPFFAVIVWSAPWTPRIVVRKMYDHDDLWGIGWHSACEFDNYRDAVKAARELRKPISNTEAA